MIKQGKTQYPKTVLPAEVVNGNFAPGLFRVKGGRALYDEVYMADGGRAVYLARVISTVDIQGGNLFSGLKAIRRWIPWDTQLEQIFALDNTPQLE